MKIHTLLTALTTVALFTACAPVKYYQGADPMQGPVARLRYGPTGNMSNNVGDMTSIALYNDEKSTCLSKPTINLPNGKRSRLFGDSPILGMPKTDTEWRWDQAPEVTIAAEKPFTGNAVLVKTIDKSSSRITYVSCDLPFRFFPLAGKDYEMQFDLRLLRDIRMAICNMTINEIVSDQSGSIRKIPVPYQKLQIAPKCDLPSAPSSQ
jgi:hypothetical protein